MTKYLIIFFLLLIPNTWSNDLFPIERVKKFKKVPFPQFIIYGNSSIGYWKSQNFSVTGKNALELNFIAPSKKINFYFLKNEKIIYKKVYGQEDKERIPFQFKILNPKNGFTLSNHKQKVFQANNGHKLIPSTKGYYFLWEPFEIKFMNWSGEIFWKKTLLEKSNMAFYLPGKKEEIILKQGDKWIHVAANFHRHLKTLPEQSKRVPSLFLLKSLTFDRYLGHSFSGEFVQETP